MNINRRNLLAAAGLATLSTGLVRTANAQARRAIRIGHITDMSGAYRDIEGPTSVACVQLAIDEFTKENPDIPVELIVGDHQNKADIGLGIIRRWLDQEGVDVLTNVGNSSIALGARSIVQERDKVMIVSSAATSELTGKGCSRNTMHWAYDTWSLARSTAIPIVRKGGDKWFFITPDYAFGHSAQADITRFVESEKGKVVGSVKYPFGSTRDFSSFLLQAQQSGANVLCFTNSGADLVNCMKQAQEFGISESGMRLTAAVGLINDVMGMSLPVAKSLTLTEAFYWDLNDRTRSLMNRLKPRLAEGAFPNMCQVGDYSAARHYLKAVKEVGLERAKASGLAVIDVMKRMPTDDDAYGPGTVRADGRKIHPMYVFEVKSEKESKAPGDIYRLIATTPADEAFRPLAEGGCSAI